MTEVLVRLLTGAVTGALLEQFARPALQRLLSRWLGVPLALFRKVGLFDLTYTSGFLLYNALRHSAFGTGFWATILVIVLWHWWNQDDDRRRRLREAQNRVTWRTFAPSPIPQPTS